MCPAQNPAAAAKKRKPGRKPGRSGITTQLEFHRPLLEALVEMGGGGRARDVLDKVGQKMKRTLKPKDYEAFAHPGQQMRWRNTVQWARNLMVNEDGRMKKDSPRGIWEISKVGRAWLKEH